MDYDKEQYNKLKMEIASDLGINMNPKYNGDLCSRDAGKVGGKIGGNMVKKMLKSYMENNLQ